MSETHILSAMSARTAGNRSKNVSMYFLASAWGTPMFWDKPKGLIP